MTVESATYIGQLNASNPSGSDAKSEGDDHLRLLKGTLLATFPGMTGAMTATHAQLNKLASTFSIASAPNNAHTISSTGAATLAAASASSGVILTMRNTGSTGAGFVIEQSGVDAWGVSMPAGSQDLVFYRSNTTEMLRLNSNGYMLQVLGPTVPTLSINRQIVWTLVGDTQLTASVRGTDGVTRTATITLA